MDKIIIANAACYLEDAPSQLHPAILSETFFHPFPGIMLSAGALFFEGKPAVQF